MEASREHISETEYADSSDAGPPGRVQRIGDRTRGLFEDLTAWVELRFRLFQIDVRERIQKKIDEAVAKAVLIAACLFVVLFGLLTIAFFVGWALGHPAWGFLVTTGLVLLVTGVLYLHMRHVRAEVREMEPPRSLPEHSLRNGALQKHGTNTKGHPRDQHPGKPPNPYT